jgi:hypothetical protein
MVTITGWVVNETPMAILFVWDRGMDGGAIWLPKSQVEVVPEEWRDRLTLPTWLAESNGIKGPLAVPMPTPRTAPALDAPTSDSNGLYSGDNPGTP